MVIVSIHGQDLEDSEDEAPKQVARKGRKAVAIDDEEEEELTTTAKRGGVKKAAGVLGPGSDMIWMLEVQELLCACVWAWAVILCTYICIEPAADADPLKNWVVMDDQTVAFGNTWLLIPISYTDIPVC